MHAHCSHMHTSCVHAHDDCNVARPCWTASGRGNTGKCIYHSPNTALQCSAISQPCSCMHAGQRLLLALLHRPAATCARPGGNMNGVEQRRANGVALSTSCSAVQYTACLYRQYRTTPMSNGGAQRRAHTHTACFAGGAQCLRPTAARQALVSSHSQVRSAWLAVLACSVWPPAAFCF